MGTKHFKCSESDRIDELLTLAEGKRAKAVQLMADLEAAKQAEAQAAETMLSLDADSIDAYLKTKAERDRLQAIVDGLQETLDLLDLHLSAIPDELYSAALEQRHTELADLFEQGFTKRILALEELLAPARKGFGDYISALLQAGKPMYEAQRLATEEPAAQYPGIVQNSISGARSVIKDIKNRHQKPSRIHLRMLTAELPSKPAKAA